MTVHPIFIGHNENQRVFEICLTKRLAEKQVKYLNSIFPNSEYYTYPLALVTSKRQLFKALKL